MVNMMTNMVRIKQVTQEQKKWPNVSQGSKIRTCL